MFSKSNALVLRVDYYRSNSAIITLLDEHHGIIKTLLNSRKIWQICQLISVEVGRQRGNFHTINLVELISELNFNDQNYYQFLQVNLWCEFLTKTGIAHHDLNRYYNLTYQLFYQSPNNYLMFGLLLNWEHLKSSGWQFECAICANCLQKTYFSNESKHSFIKNNYLINIDKQQLLCIECVTKMLIKYNDHQLVNAWFIKFNLQLHEFTINYPNLKLPNEQYPIQFIKQLYTIFNLVLLDFFNIKLKSYSFLEQELNLHV